MLQKSNWQQEFYECKFIFMRSLSATERGAMCANVMAGKQREKKAPHVSAGPRRLLALPGELVPAVGRPFECFAQLSDGRPLLMPEQALLICNKQII
jgi:hypothetical protein